MSIYALMFFIAAVVSYGGYIFEWVNKKGERRPLWKPKDEKHLKAALQRISSANTIADLLRIEEEEKRRHYRYAHMFAVACKERLSVIAKHLPPSSFEKKETKIRKTWLIAFAIQCSVVSISSVTKYCFQDRTQGLEAMLISVLVLSLVQGLVAWCVYYCAFKQKGTKLLTTLLIFSSLETAGSLVKNGIDLTSWNLTTCHLGLSVFFWISSFYLRALNLESKARRQLLRLREQVIDL